MNKNLSWVDTTYHKLYTGVVPKKSAYESGYTMLMAEAPEKPLDVEAAALYLSCSVSTLRKLVRAKVISHFRYSPKGKIYFEKVDLEAYKAERKKGLTL